MNKQLFLFLFTFLLAGAASAQFDLGIKAGTNISKIQGRSFKDEFRYGYLLGGYAEIGLGGKISIQPEVLFVQSQTRVDSSFKSIYQNVFSSGNNIKLNYLAIPLLVNYKLGNVLSLQAGPQFSILMDKNKTLLQNGKNAFDNGDFSMLGGVQLDISKLRITGRYAVGLNNINDLDNQNKWRNEAIQLSLGFGL